MNLNPNDRFLFGEEWIKKLVDDISPLAIGWQPRPSDITWTQNLIESMADGGMWGIPMNQSVWRLDKTNRVFKCVHGTKDDMFEKLTKVCAKLGYTTALAVENLPAHVIDEQLRGTGKSTSRLSNPGVI